MLVVLPNKEVAEHWDVFKEVLRTCVPITQDMLPNWLTECLFLAMCGRIQCWLAFDPLMKKDEFYAAFITKKVTDELTGQSALLVYAIQVFAKASRETRIKDMQTLGDIALSMGVRRITAYCLSPVIANALRKAFPEIEETTFLAVPLHKEEK